MLFDAGQKPLSYQQPDDANYLVRVTEKDSAAALLEQMDVQPEEIEYVVLSHTHSDHAAGVADFPQAKVILQKREAAGKQCNYKKLLLEGEYDIFGDGRLVVLPTYGHTPGHQSLLIKLDDSSKVLLTGDAAYTHEAVLYNCTKAEYQQRPEYFDTLKKLRQFQEIGVKLIFSHE